MELEKNCITLKYIDAYLSILEKFCPNIFELDFYVNGLLDCILFYNRFYFWWVFILWEDILIILGYNLEWQISMIVKVCILLDW